MSLDGRRQKNPILQADSAAGRVGAPTLPFLLWRPGAAQKVLARPRLALEKGSSNAHGPGWNPRHPLNFFLCKVGTMTTTPAPPDGWCNITPDNPCGILTMAPGAQQG